ncbi:MAG: hypothetical protein P4M12_11265 [Gammaproteobacteria bacterium]|nr:hypothetical protein [Gammaproteobacteria bacterium]
MPTMRIPFTKNFPEDLDIEILSYLSFGDLNRIVESTEVESDDLIKSAHYLLINSNLNYLNLKKSKSLNRYGALLTNLKDNVLFKINGINFVSHRNTSLESQYRELCENNSGLLKSIIKNDFYTACSEINLECQFVRDCIFHFSQIHPNEAGKLLSKNIWKFWKKYPTECLIEYGANLNIKHEDNPYSLLLVAVRSGASLIIVSKLIDNGSDYYAYVEHRHGVEYTVMLIAALESSTDILSLLAEKFPTEVEKTLLTLTIMQREYAENKYSCTFINETQAYADNKLREYYQKAEIDSAYNKLYKIAQTQHHIPRSQLSVLSSSLSHNSFFKNPKSSNLKVLPSQVLKY